MVYGNVARIVVARRDDLTGQQREAIDDLLQTLAGLIAEGYLDGDPATGRRGYPYLKATSILRFRLLGVELTAQEASDGDRE